MRKIVTLLLCFCLAVSQLMAQTTRTVSGRITDDKGAALAGATIQARGTNAKTTTGADGRFTLTISTSVRNLDVTYVGMDSRTIALGRELANYNVAMVSSNNSLEDVVVTTGISKVKQSETPGAISHVSGKDLMDVPKGSFEQMLQGKAPGVQVLSGSGQPGTAAAVIIRGVGSILGGSTPLYIMDGIAVEASVFQSINPNDFETIDILKDGFATALYGSRGSAGVIVVTTKRGVAGRMTVTADQEFGQTFRPTFNYTMMNTAQLLQSQFDLGSFYYRLGNTNGGAASGLPGWQFNRQNPNFALLSPTAQASTAATYDSLAAINTNWDDQIFRTGNFTNTNLTISGGQGRTRVYSNIGYYDEDGVTARTDLKRITLRTNLDYADDRFTLSLSSNLGYSKRDFQQSTTTNSTANPFLIARIQVPYAKVFNPDGSYATGPLPGTTGLAAVASKYTGANQLDLTKWDYNYANQIKATIGATVAYKILPSLTAGGTMGIDYRETQNTTYASKIPFLRSSVNPLTAPLTFFGSESDGITRNFNADIRPSITFKKLFASKHDVEVSAYGEYVQNVTNSFAVQAFGVDPKRPNTPAAVTQGNAVNQLYPVVDAGAGRSQSAIISGLVTARYTYDRRYTLSGSFREDGASQLPAANRWTGFYSIGGIWEASKENFLSNVKAINTLRGRVSYGSAGNANNNPFGDFGYLATYGQGNYSGLVTTVPTNVGNPNLQWEITSTLNAGIDFSLFNTRFYGSFDYYNKLTTHAYATLTLSATSGLGNGGSQNINAGTVRNRGFEYALNYDVLRGKNFVWTLSVNGSYNGNDVVDLGPIHSFPTGTSLVELGKPLFSQYTVKWGGVDAASGAPLYYDLNGKLTTTYSAGFQQNAFGTALAPWNGGFGTQFVYKGLSLSVLFSYQQGAIKTNNTEFFVENPGSFETGGYNQAAALNFWKNPGDIASTPAPSYQTNFSSKLLEDASFLRLRNVTLAYSLPKSLLAKTKAISSVRFYIIGQNLLIWTKWRGYDPESSAINIVLGEYPNPRSVTGGVEITF